MKQNNCKTKLNILSNEKESKISCIVFNRFRFSRRIANKYNILRKSSNLPVLVFLRLFGIRCRNKITNINRTESINNYLGLYFNLYFKTISRLEQMISHHEQPQKYLYHMNYIDTKHQNDSRILTNYASYFKNVSLYLKNIFHQNMYIKKRDILSSEKFALSSIRNERNKENAITYKWILPVIQLLNQVSPISNSPLFLKEDKGRLFKERLFVEQGTAFSTGMPSISYGYTKFLNYNLLKDAISLQILKPSTIINRSSNVFFKETSKTQGDIKKNQVDKISKTLNRNDFNRLTSSDNFYFYKPRKIEQEVEEIKKIVVETKESVRETPFSNYFQNDMAKVIKQHLDINRIADQVYQNLERRIRIERERRGWR